MGQHPVYRWIPISPRQQWWPFSCLPLCRRTICRHLRHSTSIIWRQCYGVGMHNSTWQNTIGCCRWKTDRYTLSGWNCSAFCHSVHPSSGQQRHISAEQRSTTCCVSSAWLSDIAKCWFVTMASSFIRSFTHWACLGWNGTTVTPSAKSASDVSGNGSGIDPHLEQYPTSIFQQLG